MVVVTQVAPALVSASYAQATAGTPRIRERDIDQRGCLDMTSSASTTSKACAENGCGRSCLLDGGWLVVLVRSCMAMQILPAGTRTVGQGNVRQLC